MHMRHVELLFQPKTSHLHIEEMIYTRDKHLTRPLD